MANPWRGEVTLVINGEPHVLRLTLGALAELEAGLKADTLVDLVARFEGGGCSSRDVLALIVAGLRGGAGAGLRRICWQRRSRAGLWRQRGWRRNCWRGRLCRWGRHEPV